MSKTAPFITLFTTPKPFTNPHIAMIQRNAIGSWRQLGDDVEILLVGNEIGMAELAVESGLRHLPDVACNDQGTPLVSSIFMLARESSSSPLLAYANADMLLTSDFVPVARHVFSRLRKFLIVGQRWDLDLRQALDFGPGWETSLRALLDQQGRLHVPAGSDFFIFPRDCFTELPQFAIGRAGWDNWMFYHARRQKWPVVDVSSACTVVHQEHDYSHLPDGQAHHRLPESFENIRLAGGRRTNFHLEDADWHIRDGQLCKIPLRGNKLLREIEIYPLIGLRSYALAQITFAIFHPVKAWKEWRGRIAYKLGQLQESND